MKIIDNNKLLPTWQKDLLCNYAKKPFPIGNFTSLHDILTKLKVDVVIEPGIKKCSVPDALYDAEKYWRDEANRLERLISDANDKEKAMGDYRRAYDNAKTIRREIENWGEMTLRGSYNPEEKVIRLYPEEMAEEDSKKYGETCDLVLLVSTLAHETMHAYFDRPGHEKFPYVVHVEEPLAEFGMLLYLYEIEHNTNTTNTSTEVVEDRPQDRINMPKRTFMRIMAEGLKLEKPVLHSPYELDNYDESWYEWAYADVSRQKTCYRYGASLMDQHLSKSPDSFVRWYLEEYKFNLFGYPMPKVSGTEDDWDEDNGTGRPIVELPDPINPWLSLQAWPKYVIANFPKCADVDYDKLAAEDPSFTKDIKLNLWPEPFIGNPDANVYILSCNPGYGGWADDLAAQCPAFIKAILDNLSHSSKRFMWFSAAVAKWPGAGYWSKRTEELRKELVQNPNIMQIEYYPYHSKNKGSCTDDNHRLPSFDYTDYLVKKAIYDKKLIIMMRCKGKWEKRIPALNNYANIIYPDSNQCTCITKSNFDGNKNNFGNTKDNWDMILQYLQK